MFHHLHRLSIRARGLLRPAGLAVLVLCSAGCGFSERAERSGKTLFTTGRRTRTLDPALAADVATSIAVGHLYDRLLEYDYVARPYELRPSMAREMPEVDAAGLTYVFKLRDDLFFRSDPCFDEHGVSAPTERRRVRSSDVVFSLLRIADVRVHSSGYWIFRGYIQGMDAFRARTESLPEGDYSDYGHGIPGLYAADDTTVVFKLTQPYPRLLNVLAMSYCSIVSEQAIRTYGKRLSEHPVGSGPFMLGEWRRNYRMIFNRYPDYRPTVAGAEYASSRLPHLDRVVCQIVKEPLTAWLLFLQGNLDLTVLTDDNFDSVVERGVDLTPELRQRGIRMVRTPQFQINYVAFNARDPIVGRNRALRRAISLAYNVDMRVKMSNFQLLPAHGPIPPGVSGYDPDFRNPYSEVDLVRARELLVEAGYPDGVSAQTGQRLVLSFDLGRTDLIGRQQAEMMVADMRKVGIEIVPSMNSWPRFLEKLKQGDVQVFRVAWIGDYPDGQNFLQLFYGPNAGSCNRAFYKNPEFDTLYEAAVNLPECTERTELYRRMQSLLVDDCPWIFESHPVSFRLIQPWLQGYEPHHFAYDHWKYLDMQPLKP